MFHVHFKGGEVAEGEKRRRFRRLDSPDIKYHGGFFELLLEFLGEEQTITQSVERAMMNVCVSVCVAT